MQSNSKVLAIVVIVVVVAFFVYWFQNPTKGSDNQMPETVTVNNDNSSNTTSPTNPSTTPSFKNGTYNVVADYMSPGGKDELGVSVTVNNNIISDVSVTNMAGDKTSVRYQDKFIAGIKSATVGQPVANLKIGVVSGASLASNAFNQALNTIRSQAAQ